MCVGRRTLQMNVLDGIATLQVGVPSEGAFSSTQVEHLVSGFGGASLYSQSCSSFSQRALRGCTMPVVAAVEAAAAAGQHGVEFGSAVVGVLGLLAEEDGALVVRLELAVGVVAVVVGFEGGSVIEVLATSVSCFVGVGTAEAVASEPH